MNQFREPYQAAQQKHDEALDEAREAVAGAVEPTRAWTEQRPRPETRLGRHLERLWRRELGLRPRRRRRKALPVLPRQRIDRRLRKLRRKRLDAYRKGLRRLRAAAAASWPARRRRFRIALLRVRLWVTPRWAFFLALPAVLALIDALEPWILDGFFDFLVLEVLGF